MGHAMGYPPLVPDVANAKIELTEGGTIRVYAGIADMGQGNASTYLQIAGEVLCQEPDAMELVLPDTDRTLPSGSSSASRTTYVYGNALIEASKRLEALILGKARDHWGLPSGAELFLRPGAVSSMDGSKELSLKEIALLLDDTERVCTGHFKAPAAEDLVNLFYMGPHIIFSYGAHLACVEVDRLTGQVEVTDYLAVTDAGKVLNPQVYEQQIQGGVVQGIGYALMEDFKVTRGEVRTSNLSTYIIPTPLDVPRIISIPVELGEDTGPFGLKGIGEIAVSGPLPAIANAIADACGVRTFSNPFTGEKILLALRQREGEGEAG
jgi:xanthine dehydrogenase, molybdenum binding subunit apoprotein (EC 1.17.1.4)